MFTGAYGATVRTARDFGVNLNEKLYVVGRGAANGRREAAAAGGNGRGVGNYVTTKSNADGMDKLREAMERQSEG